MLKAWKLDVVAAIILAIVASPTAGIGIISTSRAVPFVVGQYERLTGSQRSQQ